jgi:hypothetical protein
MQTLEHNQMGLAPMTEVEMQEIEGGGFWKWYCIIAAALLVVGICIETAGLGLVVSFYFPFCSCHYFPKHKVCYMVK